jgi:hypothetical protein
MERSNWIDHKFIFGYPTGWLPNILERLNGTSARMKEMILSLTEAETGRKHEGKWSIKDHIGHLADLEELHSGRIDDFLERKKILRSADMTNVRTNEANHSAKSTQKLLNDFTVRRKHFIQKVQNLDDDTYGYQSKHPRLNKLMRPVDLAFFTAEHDDHHLATIREIINRIKNDTISNYRLGEHSRNRV